MNQSLKIAVVVALTPFMFLACSDQLANRSPTAGIQQMPGQPNICFVFIPYRYSDAGGQLAGSLTAAQVPGVSAGGHANSNWGYLPYYGYCNDPKSWQPGAIPGISKSATQSDASKSKDISSPVNTLGAKIVSAAAKASNSEAPTTKKKVASLIHKSVPLYLAVDKVSNLQPYGLNKTPAAKVILSLDKTSNAFASGSGAAEGGPNQAQHYLTKGLGESEAESVAPSGSAISRTAQLLINEADQIQ